MIFQVTPFLLKLLVDPFKMSLDVYHSCKKTKRKGPNFSFSPGLKLFFDNFGSMNFLSPKEMIL